MNLAPRMVAGGFLPLRPFRRSFSCLIDGVQSAQRVRSIHGVQPASHDFLRRFRRFSLGYIVVILKYLSSHTWLEVSTSFCAPYCAETLAGPRRLENELPACLQDISLSPELGILPDCRGHSGVAVAIGCRDQLLGFWRTGEGNSVSESVGIGVADSAGGCMLGQAGIASLVGFVDIGRTPAVASGTGARSNQQDKKDESRSHAKPPLGGRRELRRNEDCQQCTRNAMQGRCALVLRGAARVSTRPKR